MSTKRTRFPARSARVLVAAAVLTLVTLISVLACAPPPQTPTQADATAGLSICFSKEGDDDTAGSAELRKALGQRLAGAGYKLVEKGRCDIRLHWSYTFETRGGDSSYTSVTFTIRGRTDDVLEKIKVERNRGDAPIEKPDLIAVPIVNAMNASPKLAAYAASRRRPAGARDGGAGSADAGTTELGTTDSGASVAP